ncbi:hypothetical protein [Streptomyces sp. 5-10]|uniref:hypothetical protein n=1 Tax=Streptomyces sp. 5-10 TaxID=878925 RepID=UPI00168ABE1A|nr:hypothetical protein [Streptomyces sp. 5-10]MBD3004751.1 hypothetical protein [Streptomyces sp. 5-10]
MKIYTFTRGKFNVHYLKAPYELLVAAFGDDGTVSPRDEDKSTTSWDVRTPSGTVEVYDYLCGVTYGVGGPDRSDITEWHVRGSVEAIDHMLARLDEASRDGKPRKAVPPMPLVNYMKLMGRDD